MNLVLARNLFTAFSRTIRNKGITIRRRLLNFRNSKHWSVNRLLLATFGCFYGYMSAAMADTRHQEGILGLRQMNKEKVCSSTDIKEGQLFSFRRANDPDEQYIVITRYKEKLYGVGGLCPYDGKAQLGQGVIFGDKLCCPDHGCAFDIETGTVEYPPAIDNLPRFRVFQKDGEVWLDAPKVLPRKVLPKMEQIDKTDLRKVVIVGSGMAALGCIEGLRQNGYSGQITLISKQFLYPYEKSKLYTDIKDAKYDRLFLRPYQWYQMFGVTVIFGRQVVNIEKKHAYPFLQLEDGTRIEFDGLLLATGSRPTILKEIPGLTDNASQSFMVRHLHDHIKLRKKLSQGNVQEVSIIGLTPKSLQFTSTLKRDYPNLKINIIDSNQTNKLQSLVGSAITSSLLDWLHTKGVGSYCGLNINQVRFNQKKMLIDLQDGFTVQADIAVLFPSTEHGNTQFVSDSLSQNELNENMQLKTDTRCRTDTKRVFAAGSCSAVEYFGDPQKMPVEHETVAYQQGYTSAYNMLALNIPYHMVPQWSIESLGRRLDFTGYCDHYSEIIVVGDVEKWDFLAFYSQFGRVTAVSGTPSNKNAIPIFREVIRLGLMPPVQKIKQGVVTPALMQQVIKIRNKSGCYKDLVNSIQERYVPEDIIWIHRDVDRYAGDKRTNDQEGFVPESTDEKGYFKDIASPKK